MNGTGSVVPALVAIAATALVLAIAWAALALLARASRRRLPSGGQLRVVRGVAVGTRERVVLLRDGDSELLLGVSPGGVTLLDKRPAATTDAADAGSAERRDSKGRS